MLKSENKTDKKEEKENGRKRFSLRLWEEQNRKNAELGRPSIKLEDEESQ